jgi:hypothetical protein
MHLLSRAAIVVTCLVVSTSSVANAQGTTRIEVLKANPRAYIDTYHTLVGKVTRYAATPGNDAYYVEDDYGHDLRVVTATARPNRGDRITVSGTLAVDVNGDGYLVAQQTSVMPPAGALEAVGPATTSAPSPFTNPILLGSLALGIGVLILVWMRTRAPAQVELGGGGAAGPGPMLDPGATQKLQDDWMDGKTIKFARPVDTSGTLKLLPGRLQITGGGDAGQEIRFVKTSSGPAEITFGRSDGPPHTHIQLKAQTVSRRHAVMRFDAGQWHLANQSDTNPVIVNGAPLSAAGKVLATGDVIEMGEVQFQFQER